MTIDTFLEWLRRKGHRVVRTASSWWYDQGPRVYQAFPYHWTIQPSEQELRDLLVRERAIALRYSAPLEAPYSKISYHVVFDSGPYTIETLSPNARSKVRRGLKHCTVERIPMERLAQEGWRLQQDTLERQGRSGSLHQADWQRLCITAKDLPSFEAWGAIIRGELAATILTSCIDDTYYMLYPQSHRDYLDTYVNNALAYSVSHELLLRPGTRMIFYGLHSLDAPSSVDEFKFRMSYRAKPVSQRVVFHPWLQPAFNRGTHALVKRLLRWKPEHTILAKLEGMLRFYLDGKEPANQQSWPECLTDRKMELREA